MKRIVFAVIGLCILAVWPPVTQAQQTVTYTWTAPTTGGAVSAYQFAVKSGSSAWATMTDSTAARSVTYTQPDASVHQTRARAFNHILEAVTDASGQLIGTRYVRQYGPWSDYSIPNVVSPAAPGGCGRPVKQ